MALTSVRTLAVRAALDQVTDPELDESVVKLGFITDIKIVDDDKVHIDFRLPTYWCAANFSYLMAADMRDAVTALPWVHRVEVRLDEHMFVEAINAGIAAGQDFTEAFASEASETLDSLRRHFGLKSFERRQDALLRHLLTQDHQAVALVAMSLAALRGLALSDDGATLRARYLARRGLVGGGELAFVTSQDEPIMAETLGVYLRHIHRIGLNAEFNAALCSGLLAARYGAAPGIGAESAEPELIDFIRAARKAPGAPQPVL